MNQSIALIILLLKEITSSFQVMKGKRLNDRFDSFLYKNSAPKAFFRRKKGGFVALRSQW